MADEEDGEREDRKRRFHAAMEEQIADKGYFLQGVHAGPPWTYTIGLSDAHLSELIVVGMSLRRAAAVIELLVGEARSGDRDWPAHGGTLRGLLGDHELRAVAVDENRPENRDMWLLGAYTRRQRRGGIGPPSALQLVWQDETFEWNLAGTEEQPLLGQQWW